ncbi:hypothetical protein [Buchananella hordeovulneris]|uniref:TIGR03986 family CRISPR-associated RAMP protein n=1 Tax=Buchananella hordeovulneris TaxID=52770 RepID=A0A1Q5PUX0_9ACTO|nr:hypothetical protein [Buchananella hordeovulneris]MDO5080949.1 hypothetical protein [Buchananella hordeovulneris]OKL51296.1 hypothetical protein BSZ40_08285 [Buchananella hordeovulneris]
MTAFHSAVNRIPVLRGEHRHQHAPDTADLTFLDDAVPGGHAALEPGLYSGTLTLKLTTATPLVYGERIDTAAGPAVSIPMRDGQVFVPPTMLKGMLSRAYEAVTASRFRIFGQTKWSATEGFTNSHATPLTYRCEPIEALQLVPVRVVSKDGRPHAEILWGPNTQPSGKGKLQTHMRAAALPDRANHHVNLLKPLATIRALTPHGQAVRFEAIKVRHPKNPYFYWLVTSIHDGNKFVQIASPTNGSPTPPQRKQFSGYVYRTADHDDHTGDTPDGTDGIHQGKHDEKIFFCSPAPLVVPLAPEALTAYKLVRESYLRNALDELDPSDGSRRPRTPPPPDFNRFTKASLAHMPAQLADGDLAFAVLSPASYLDRGSICREPVIEQLVPIMIGQRAYRLSPHSLAQAQQVLPLASPHEASPADRLFGYVTHEGNITSAQGHNYRSRLWVSGIDTSGMQVRDTSKTLAPLMSPKPASGRRFLLSAAGENLTTAEEHPLPRRQLFQTGQFLGRAAFPVHRQAVVGLRSALDEHQFPRAATHTRHTELPDGGQETQTTVLTWIPAGQEFTATLTCENLTIEEVAVLRWLLQPGNLCPKGDKRRFPDDVGYLQMGLGKPFGLGAVRVELESENLVGGADLAAAYEQLSGCLGASHSPGPKPTVVAESLQDSVWVRAFKQAAYGYREKDGSPIALGYLTPAEHKENNACSPDGTVSDNAGWPPPLSHGRAQPAPFPYGTLRKVPQSPGVGTYQPAPPAGNPDGPAAPAATVRRPPTPAELFRQRRPPAGR